MISLVIPTHQRPKALSELLRSLEIQDFPRDEFEVIVVSNFEDSETEDVCLKFSSAFKKIEYLVSGRKGSNRARNKGLARSKGEIVFFVDDDCIFTHPYVLQQIQAAHTAHPKAIAIGGGYITPLNASPVERAFGLICEKWLSRRSLPDQSVFNLVGGNVSYKRTLLEKNGFNFNPAIEYGGAETELHARLFLAGFNFVFLPDLRLEHRANVSALDFLRKAFMQGFSSQKRWQNGLFIPSQAHAGPLFEHHLPLVAFWERVFDRTFRIGQRYANWDSENNTIVPNMERRNLFKFAAFLIKEAFSRSNRKALSWFAAHQIFFSVRTKIKPALPLERHYLLPTINSCDIPTELERAKTYGYKNILVPDVWGSLHEAEQLRAQIVAKSLRPVAMIDGDRPENTLAVLDQFYNSQWDFHVLLGKASVAQDQIFENLNRWKKDWTLTLFSKAKRSDLKKISRLRPSFRNKVHYVFSSTASLWHSHPSSLKMARFLKKAAHLQEDFLTVRGATASWPSNRRVHNSEDLWPLQPVQFELGTLTAPPLFSVVIPAYEAGEQLVQVVKHLLLQKTDGFEYEIIIVDDGSRIPADRMLRKNFADDFPQLGKKLKFIYWPRNEQATRNFRAGKARNLGVTHATGEFLCFLDSDIIVSDGYLLELKSLFQKYDVIQAKRENLTASASAALLSNAALDTVKEIYPEDEYWEGFKKLENWQATRLFWKYSCTYSFSLRKKHFLDAGWFAPEFYTYGFEDVDLGYRLAQMKLRFYLNSNPVYHLYPEKTEFNYHFNLKERTRTLTLSSRVFYRLRLDPHIFAEFFPSFYQPVRGELELQYEKASRISVIIQCKMRRLFFALNPIAQFWRIQECYWAVKFFLRDTLGVVALKPWHFANYQWQTRIATKIKNSSEELSDGSTENI